LSEPFLLLGKEERVDAYLAASDLTGLPPKILEKDVWICWALNVLYGQTGHFPMAFKGGTSLSKVFDAIDRFSEDIDITVTLPVHDPDKIPEGSRSQRGRLTKKVAVDLDAYLESTVVPLLVTALENYSADPGGCVSKIDSETVVLDYPSCYSKEGGYLAERVKVEFGARNQVTPSESHSVIPYVRKVLTDAFSLPTAVVDVLAGERTFWEKATLAHDECNRADLSRGSANRISRHWYDLSRLADHEIGVRALGDRELLKQVVTVKKAFYWRKTSDYEECLNGAMRLVPDAAGVSALGADYEAMIEAGMFRGEPPDFDSVIDRVRILETTINAS
jgi:predicted nucleotidyltransferase component of viral defense system